MGVGASGVIGGEDEVGIVTRLPLLMCRERKRADAVGSAVEQFIAQKRSVPRDAPIFAKLASN